MKLLFDENLPPRLARILADLYPNSTHVHECGLGSADDSAIWRYAKESGFTIVSKDSDFQDRSILQGHPPKFIWVRAENCSAREIESLLRTAGPDPGGLPPLTWESVCGREYEKWSSPHLVIDTAGKSVAETEQELIDLLPAPGICER